MKDFLVLISTAGFIMTTCIIVMRVQYGFTQTQLEFIMAMFGFMTMLGLIAMGIEQIVRLVRLRKR